MKLILTFRKFEIYLKGNNEMRINRGLNGTQETKGPLSRILKFTLEGDDNDDIWNMDV